MYWIRRVAIVVLAVAVLVGLVWFLANRSSGSSPAASTFSSTANAPAAPTLTGVLAASSGATRSTDASTSPLPTEESLVVGSPTVSDGASASTDSAALTLPPTEAPADAPPPTDQAAAPPAETPAAPPADPAPVPPADPTPAPPPPSYDVDGTLLCPDSAITITAITTAPSFPSGGQPTLGMTVTNTGTEACRRDVSGTLQTFTVLGADGSRKWSTADCFPGEGTEIRDLAPSQELEYTIKWSGTTSEPGCAGERAPVPPGDYQLVAQLAGLSSAPTPFAITG